MKLAQLSVISFGVFLSVVPAIQAGDLFRSFECKQKSGNALIEGRVTGQEVIVKISDSNRYSGFTHLGIYSYTADFSREWIFERMSDRKKESTYKYVNYFNDNSPTQNFTLALPKTLLQNSSSEHFVAYFTVANDNGDMMVPSPAEVLDCVSK